jgi:hypothetical protein
VSLDDRIDDLFKQPLNEFTRARNALMKEVRGADATRVRTLAKPSVIAWAANQVYWRARSVYDRLMKSGERVRKAQIAALTGKSADIREANDAHRRAVADAVKEAQRFAAEAGSRPGPDALMRTFEALSLAGEPPAAPGRMSKELRPAGFEALAGVTPKIRVRHVRLKPDATQSPSGARLKPDATQSPSGVRLQRPSGVRLQPDKRQTAAEARRRAAEERKRAAEEKKRAAAVKKAEAAVERARQKMLAAQEALKRTREG